MRKILSGVLVVWLTVATADAEEEVGRWRWSKADKPVKVVVLGGSIGAWPAGAFHDYFRAVCRNVELRNLSKVGYGAPQLKQRFRAQVLKNPGARPRSDTPFEHWLIYSGGLNSVGSPAITIKETMATFQLAHANGLRVVALSLTPWGDDSDRRWRDFGGLEYREKTQRTVDYLMGRLPRSEALGPFAETADAAWAPGELPEVAVDLYDSVLRAKDAPPRDATRLDTLWGRNKKLQKQLPDRAAAVTAATALPSWFLRKELRSFDHVHPNGAGHKLMAEAVCPSLPQSWGCDCGGVHGLVWEGGSLRSDGK